MTSVMPVRLSWCKATEITSTQTFLDLLIAARTAKLDATQKELSDALSAWALAKENTAQLEKRWGCKFSVTRCH